MYRPGTGSSRMRHNDFASQESRGKFRCRGKVQVCVQYLTFLQHIVFHSNGSLTFMISLAFLVHLCLAAHYVRAAAI